MILEFIYILLAFIIYFLFMYKKNHMYFSSKNVKYLPGFPIFGNSNMKNIFEREQIHREVNHVYKAFPKERYVGFADGVTPIIMIRDPEIFKEVLVEAHDHFATRREFGRDPLAKHNLIAMTGDDWRNMRQALSPVFTTSKLRQMIPFLNESSRNMVGYLKENQKDATFVHSVVSKYLTDNFFNSALGLTVNSFEDPRNDFYKMYQKLELFTTLQKIKFTLVFLFPVLSKLIPIFPVYVLEFYREKIWRKYSAYRQENKVERADLLQHLMKTNSEMDWSPDQIAAQIFVFNTGSVFSTASGAIMAIHELALNPEVQEKLFKKVSAHHQNNKDKERALDTISELNYLDCVWKETLRKFPPFFLTDRICTKPYTLPPSTQGAEPYHMKPGEMIIGPIHAIHNDEKYFAEPEKFYPERFSPENKDKLTPYTYIPFGNGLRKCIGERYATLLQKTIIYHLVLNFKIMKHEKTIPCSSGWPIDSLSIVQFKYRN